MEITKKKERDRNEKNFIYAIGMRFNVANGITSKGSKLSRNAQVRTHYQTTPFVGKVSDYTYLLSSTKGNLYKDVIISDIETSIMATSIGFLCMNAAIAITVAGAIQSAVKIYTGKVYEEKV